MNKLIIHCQQQRFNDEPYILEDFENYIDFIKENNIKEVDILISVGYFTKENEKAARFGLGTITALSEIEYNIKSTQSSFIEELKNMGIKVNIQAYVQVTNKDRIKHGNNRYFALKNINPGDNVYLAGVYAGVNSYPEEVIMHCIAEKKAKYYKVDDKIKFTLSEKEILDIKKSNRNITELFAAAKQYVKDGYLSKDDFDKLRQIKSVDKVRDFVEELEKKIEEIIAEKINIANIKRTLDIAKKNNQPTQPTQPTQNKPTATKIKPNQ